MKPTLSKNITYSPKDILAIDGRVAVKQGRGRMSKAAVDRITELVNEGYRVKGYAANSSTANKATPDEPVEVKRVSVNNNEIAEFVILWDLDEYKAIDENGKEWGMREICNNCMVSLVQCHCHNSTILGDIRVSIVRR